MPRTVTIRSGLCGSRSILWRRFGDVDVADVVVRVVARVPEPVQDLAAGDDPPRLLAEQREQLELRRGEVHGTLVDDDLAQADVDAEPADLPDGPARCRALVVAPAKQRPHAADELGRRAGLRHAVVGAELEREHPVDLGPAGAERDQGNGADRSQPAEHVEPGEPAQIQIEDDDVDRAAHRRAKGALPVDCLLDLVALAA